MRYLCTIKPLSGGLRKKWRLPSSFFPCCFFLSNHFSWGILRNKITFFGFLKKSQNRHFCFAIFSMKNALTEKTKYTMTKSTEKQKRWQSSFFRRPPESGLSLHRSCEIYDGRRPPEIVILSLFQFPWEMQNL